MIHENVTIGFKVSPEVKEKIRIAGKNDGRVSISEYVRQLVIHDLKQKKLFANIGSEVKQ